MDFAVDFLLIMIFCGLAMFVFVAGEVITGKVLDHFEQKKR